MPDYRIRLLPEELRSINSASFNGTYQAIGTPLEFPSRVIAFVNNSGVLVTISWDGISDHLVLVAGASFTMDENANSVADSTFVTAAGTQFYVKGSASTGFLYLSTFYVT